MNAKFDLKRETRDQFFYALTVSGVLRRHCTSLPPEVSTLSFEELKAIIARKDRVEIEEPFLILKNFFNEENGESVADDLIGWSPIGPLVVGTTYLFRHWNCKDSDIERAWSYLADSLFWSGYATSGRTLGEFLGLKEKDFSEDELQTLQLHGAKILAHKQGVKAKEIQNAIGREVHDFARQLAREKMPLGGWSSFREATHAIADDLRSFARTRGRTIPPLLHSSDRIRSVEKWLSEVPELFYKSSVTKKL